MMDVYVPYLLDEHVEVLWNLWCKACGESLCQSVTKQRHNKCIASVSPISCKSGGLLNVFFSNR